MIFKRDDYNRWILQKNINNKKKILDYLGVLDLNKNKKIEYSEILKEAKNNYAYYGRSQDGSESTMSVRMSQINFYMFGYKSPFTGKFFPTPITEELFRNRISEDKLILCNLFMMQYPHPNSKVGNSIDIYLGRLLVQLLLDERIDCKLYTDELIYIIPFVTNINNEIYNDLIKEIIKYRSLSYTEKENKFKQIANYEAFFSKITHEMIYYFLRIFISFGVFDAYEDPNHNDGNVFKFKQGKETTRYTSIKSRGKKSGYIQISNSIKDLSQKLIDKFTLYDSTYKIGYNHIYNEEHLLNDMYIKQSYDFLRIIAPDIYIDDQMTNILEYMREKSIDSPDGKDFEKSLALLFNEFDETISVNQLSGPGKTDIFYVFDFNYEKHIINIEAKSGVSGNNVNVKRIERHMDQTNAEYCLMVAPRFSRGTYLDIKDSKISTITTEALYKYCRAMLVRTNYRSIPYGTIHLLAKNNPGQRIDYKIDAFIKETIY